MRPTQQRNLRDMLKALADDSRLKLLRMLHEREHTVGELAQRIDLTEPTVSHHLANLREAGLVTLRMAGNQRIYRINEPGLAAFKRLANEIEQMPPEAPEEDADNSWIAVLGWSEEDQQVLNDHMAGRHLTRLPTKRKQLLVILRWLVTLFEHDRKYTEGEVNAILKTAYELDYVGLRRDLVDFRYMKRERDGSSYWLAPDED
jgi:predicted transcriptional regulator